MKRSVRLWPLAVFLALVICYFNAWMWDSQAIVFGFPINLLYHVGVCCIASICMLAIVQFAWPHELDQDDPE